MNEITYDQQPPVEFDDIGDVVAVRRLFVGEVKLHGDAKVATDDDHAGQDQVEGKEGNDERGAFLFHLPPGQRAGQPEGLRAVPPPAQDRKQGPYEGVQPGPQAQDLHLPPTDFLLCKQERTPLCI